LNDPIAIAHLFLSLLDGIINSSVYEKAPIKPEKNMGLYPNLD